VRITFLGPPGSGKGTQAEKLSAELDIPHIATGDILRDSIRKNTAIGRKVKSYVESGGLVPDEVVLELVLGEAMKMKSFVLDGFPRTLVQAERLDEIAPIELSVFFEVSETTVVARLTGRRICPRCSRVYNLSGDRSVVKESCDVCGVSLIIREDDHERIVRRRIQIYRKETLPLREYYMKKGVLKHLNAEGDPDTVYERLKDALLEDDSPEI
jgi:adenylate kinase